MYFPHIKINYISCHFVGFVLKFPNIAKQDIFLSPHSIISLNETYNKGENPYSFHLPEEMQQPQKQIRGDFGGSFLFLFLMPLHALAGT